MCRRGRDREILNFLSDVGFPGTVDVFRPLDKKLCYSEVTLRKMSGLGINAVLCASLN